MNPPLQLLFCPNQFSKYILFRRICLMSVIRVIPFIDRVLGLQGIFKQKSHNLRQFNLLQWSNDAISAACSSCLCFFGGNPSRKETRAEGGSSQEISRRSPSSQRRWTNVLLAVNVLLVIIYVDELLVLYTSNLYLIHSA